jgi:glycosyltransferase involved in cell wall biosynthesis
MILVQQLLAAAAPHDAVTGQALALARLLEGWGLRSEVAAEHVHPDLADAVTPLSRRDPEPDAVILRYSIWSEAVEEVLARPPRRLGVVYHNVTPPEFLRAVNPTVAALCARARAGLAVLAPAAHVALADSGYNAAEAEDAGFADVRVIPLLLDLPPRRPDGPPPGPPGILTVGRVVPNKRLEVLVRALALLRAAHRPDAELWVVGAWDGFEPYREALERFAGRLGTGGVRLLGRVSAGERDERYRRAAAYACASAHEGFCAPLVEAMAVGIPVVAVDATAVPETLGGGGLLLPDDDAATMAEALDEVLGNAALRDQLAAAAERRLAELAPERVAAALREAVAELVGGPLP